VRSIQAPTQAPIPLSAWAAWAAVCFFWGTTYLAIRIGIRTLPPALFAGLRFVAAGLILGGICRACGLRYPNRKEWAPLTIIGFLLLVLGNGGVVAAERWVDSGLTALVLSMLPIWMALLNALTGGGERLTLRGAAGLALGMGGVALLVYHPGGGSPEPAAHRALGILILEGASICWAGGSLYGKRFSPPVAPLMGAAAQMLAGGLILCGIGTAAGEWSRLHFDASGFGSLIYLMIFGSLVGYGSFVFALSRMPATTVSLYAYVNPVVALLCGLFILHEPLSLAKLAAAGVILGGVALAQSGVRHRTRV